MANINATANLYLFALCFAGITVYLYVLYLQNHSWKNRFFWLPFIHFITAGTFITLQINILLLPVTSGTTLEVLYVFYIFLYPCVLLSSFQHVSQLFSSSMKQRGHPVCRGCHLHRGFWMGSLLADAAAARHRREDW